MQLSSPSRRRRWRSRPRKQRSVEIFQSRFFLIKAIFLLLFGVLLVQLARMQIVQHDSYSARAESNRLRTAPVLASRGLIYDRNGEQLVENVPIFSAAVIPADVRDNDVLRVVAELAGATGEPASEIAAKIVDARDSNDPYTPVIVKEDINNEVAFTLRERQADIPGVQVLVESVRAYTAGDLAAHYLGYVGRINEEEYENRSDRGYLLNDRLGKAGVETAYESVLRGQPGYRLAEIDAAGRETKVIRSVPPQPAGNLVLSLDLDLQRQVTRYLQDAMGSSQTAAAVVMDIKTGDVLSMVSLPSYDNNILTDPVDQDRLPELLGDTRKPMVNHTIAEVHPPGSTFKQITGTAALQEGIANAATTITSTGSISVEDEYVPGRFWTMRDWAALGTLDFYQGLAMSSDVYFYYLSGGFYQSGLEVFHGLGAARLARYAREYGLGSPTGIDLPGEAAGLVPDPDWKEQAIGEVWTLGDTYNFGIGQGYLTVTPMQLVRVSAAIANGGDILVPHVVNRIVDEHGATLHRIEPTVSQKLTISDDNLAIMREAMRQAAVYGPAKTGASSQVTIAAKTGTAEFGQQSADGRYELSHAWYVGYAPFDNPEIAVVVFLERGVGATNGGPVAKQIFDYYFSRSNLAGQEQAP